MYALGYNPYFPMITPTERSKLELDPTDRLLAYYMWLSGFNAQQYEKKSKSK